MLYLKNAVKLCSLHFQKIVTSLFDQTRGQYPISNQSLLHLPLIRLPNKLRVRKIAISSQAHAQAQI